MKNGDRVFLKPAAGLKVRNPQKDGAHMPAEGDAVTLDTHFRRLLKAGDVALATQPGKPKPPAAPKKED